MVKGIRPQIGDVYAIPLADATHGFGVVLTDPLMAFYDLHCHSVPSLEKISSSPIAFKICVFDNAIKNGQWQRLGRIELTEELLEEPLFFKKDIITGELTIYRDSTGEEIPATLQECELLECAAVWEPEHVVDRLQDHFAGRPNQWVESLRP